MDMIQRRILVCNLIEKMDQKPQFSKKLGLKNESVFAVNTSASHCNRFGEKKDKGGKV